ncbi:tRNA (guanine-N(7)-)-methyltransferase non-catalytic subunit WDR4 [Acipenser ruthenus]|uniref:tRNA (Guanine-N(7)-)-methyltransferase non-catalytic subunit WDR4 n=1 Tax=Acipenser ruthenus TaxID=7906 RepID=A0A662YRW8_ACIRT|nr:tRNA (guanine-N(7)-)-methyltransferase non-catalytic subunit WDR4 [Acipenser ruthenus]
MFLRSPFLVFHEWRWPYVGRERAVTVVPRNVEPVDPGLRHLPLPHPGEVHLFQIDTGTQRLEFKETVRLAHNSWDVAFDESAGLWVLQQNKVSTATLYRLREGHWQCAVEDPKLKTTVDILSNHWDMFQVSLDAESRYHNLYKSVFDNMAAYLLKKEERIQQQGKRMKGQLPESSGAKNI